MFVPPRATARVPVQPAAMDAALTRAVVGLPPSVSVTFVSSVLVRAARAPLPVPPRATERVPVQPSVSDAALSRAVDAEPPRARVALVSSVLVRAWAPCQDGSVPSLLR